LGRALSGSRAWAERSAIFWPVLFWVSARTECSGIVAQALSWVTRLGGAVGNLRRALFRPSARAERWTIFWQLLF